MGDPAAVKEKVRQFPDAPGVYLMKDAAGAVIYVGKATSLRKRVMSYFADSPSDTRPAIPKMVSDVADVDFVPAESTVDALLMEARLIKDIQPRYNRDLKDGKLYPYLQVTRGEDFPAVYITRRADDRRSRYFGPFTEAGELQHAAQLMQRIFKFRTCTLPIEASDEKRRFSRPCLLYHIDRCSGPCADRVSVAAYHQQISLLLHFLAGKRARVLAALKRSMKERSDALDFEVAAALRDQIKALDSLSRTGDIVSFPEAFAAPVAEFQQGLIELQKKMELARTPRRVDGVDVAVIHGSAAVGSIVTFVDGKPFKPGYRRFRIKKARRDDDYAMICEVVERRFKRLVAEEEPFPDVLLIDGGAGHLNAVAGKFRAMGMRPPTLIALAKREETARSLGPDGPREVRGLTRHSPALRVLQHVRDEAHRFAQHYHHLLRSKVLDTRKRKRRTPGA